MFSETFGAVWITYLFYDVNTNDSQHGPWFSNTDMECLVLRTKSPQKERLKRHLRHHAAKPHICPTCSKSLCRRDELRAHIPVDQHK